LNMNFNINKALSLVLAIFLGHWRFQPVLVYFIKNKYEMIYCSFFYTSFIDCTLKIQLGSFFNLPC
jgi:hypothetical protein